MLESKEFNTALMLACCSVMLIDFFFLLLLSQDLNEIMLGYSLNVKCNYC